MDRRKFLRSGSLAGAGLTAAGILSFNDTSANKNSKDEAGNEADQFELNEATIEWLQQQMQNGKLSSEQITRLYLTRIEKIDKSGPYLNAVIEINPDALQMARSLDQDRKNGNLKGPLHGIPVLIKDNINTGDKMMTTAGSLALLGNVAASDAFIIGKLREAGAVLLGKTNLSEWANFRSTRSTSGWSSRGGQTKCPYLLDRNPSGSSAGSGSAVAANLCALAIGTETDGSIVSPSSVNGIVGIKPTVGLWSRSGIIPISATQDTAGPMARTVRDAAILLGCLTGVDSADPVTAAGKNKAAASYTPFLDKKAMQGKTIGIEKSHLKGHEGVVALYLRAIQVMKNLGASIVEIDLLKALNDIGNAEFTVLQYEFKDGLNRYLSSSNCKLKTLQDVISFNSQNESKAMPFFKQETLISSQSKGDLSTKEYTDALSKTLSSRKIISDLMAQNHLDAIAGVTNGSACCIDLVNGDYDTGFSYSTPAAMAGYPHITIPMGLVGGLPVGLSFISTAYEEPQIIALGYAFEQATLNRVSPKFQKDLLG